MMTRHGWAVVVWWAAATALAPVLASALLTPGGAPASAVGPTATARAAGEDRQRHAAVTRADLIPTTTTIEVPTGWAWSPVPVTCDVEPAPDFAGDYTPALIFRVVDGLRIMEPMGVDGRATALLDLAPGEYRVFCSFSGFRSYAASTSEEAPLQVGVTTSVSIDAAPNPARDWETVAITVRVAAAGGIAMPGGQLTLTDLTTAQQLASITVGPDASSTEVTPSLAVGEHHLRAEYSGSGRFGASLRHLTQSVVLDEVVNAAELGIAPSSFYPVLDGYRDVVRVTGDRREPISIGIAVRSGSGHIVRAVDLPSAEGLYHWDWNGRDDGGTLLADGSYTITQTLTDRGDNTLVSSADVTLSRQRLRWTTVTRTLSGSEHVAALRTRGGTVSSAASAYPDGVRIRSGLGSASVHYRIPLVAARFYGDVRFEVLGRSTDARRASIGLWDARLGAYTERDSFQARRTVGPGYRWWSTSTAVITVLDRRRVRATVDVWNGLGGPGIATFDIAKVRFVYRWAVLR